MQRTLIIVMLICQLSVGGTVQAANWWVNFGTGSDAANGNSKATAWRTLKAARSNTGIQPGDNIYIVGGTYNASQYFSGVNDYPLWTEAHRKGSPGNPITIMPEPGTTVILDGENINGLWLNFYPAVATAYYIIIKGLEFRHWKGSTINVGNTAVAAGTNVIASNIGIIGNYIHDMYQGTSSALGTQVADRIIYKDNVIITTGDPTFGFPDPSSADHAYYLSHGSSNIVIDHAYNEKIAGFGFHLWADSTPGWTTSNVIIRNSTTVNANHSGMIMSGGTYNKVYVYNNTFYSEAATYPSIQSSTGIVSTQASVSFHHGGTYSNIRLKNNIGYGYIDGGSGHLWSDAGWTGSGIEFDYNWWTLVGGGGNMYTWLATSYNTLAAFRAATPYGDNDATGNPLFVSPGSPTRNFSLGAGSPAIDAGDYLTRAVGAAVSPSTSLTVVDAGYFHDGFGLGAQIPGDSIKIGAGAVVGISSINYSTNVITLAAARTWSNNDGVSLAYNGAKPDMGALESGVPVTATQLKFVTQPATTTVGSTLAPFTVQIWDAANTLVTSATDTVTLTTTGTGVTGTLSQAAVGGIATFNGLSFNTANTAATFTATATGLTSDVSSPFDILAVAVAPIARLRFVPQ